MLGVMLLGVFALTSCVQDDMYELYDDDLSSEGMIARRKFKAEGSNSGNNNEEWTQKKQEKAEKWVYNSQSAGNGECVPSVICYMLGSTMPAVRTDIGPGLANASEHWEFYYYLKAKKGDGFPIGTSGAASLIASKCSVSAWDKQSLKSVAISGTDWDITHTHGTYTAPSKTYVVQIDNNHWGVLDRIENMQNNDPSVYIIEYGSNGGPYAFSRITYVMK